jgi:hypothetical protein
MNKNRELKTSSLGLYCLIRAQETIMQKIKAKTGKGGLN